MFDEEIHRITRGVLNGMRIGNIGIHMEELFGVAIVVIITIIQLFDILLFFFFFSVSIGLC
jgi:hypothetical protein